VTIARFHDKRFAESNANEHRLYPSTVVLSPDDAHELIGEMRKLRRIDPSQAADREVRVSPRHHASLEGTRVLMSPQVKHDEPVWGYDI
jgi:hypothetical protein